MRHNGPSPAVGSLKHRVMAPRRERRDPPAAPRAWTARRHGGTASGGFDIPAWVALLVLLFAVLLVYRNARSVPFLFNDQVAILENPTVTHRSRSGRCFPRPFGRRHHGRTEQMNASFAGNYIARGTRTVGHELQTAASVAWFRIR